MPKCDNCGKRGLFLKINSNGLCKNCEESKRIEERQISAKNSVFKRNRNGRTIEPVYSHSQVNDLQLKRAEQNKMDLIMATCHNYHCGECSKYINRVYSISGKDSRFPRLPDYIKNNSDHCHITLYPFTYGASFMNDPYTNKGISGSEVIQYSNRPYTDTRPLNWVEGYRKLEAKKNNHDNYENEYKLICQLLPNDAPKSQAGYTRMKKSNSENYRSLAEKARQAGIIIHDIEKED